MFARKVSWRVYLHSSNRISSGYCSKTFSVCQNTHFISSHSTVNLIKYRYKSSTPWFLIQDSIIKATSFNSTGVETSNWIKYHHEFFKAHVSSPEIPKFMLCNYQNSIPSHPEQPQGRITLKHLPNNAALHPPHQKKPLESHVDSQQPQTSASRTFFLHVRRLSPTSHSQVLQRWVSLTPV